MSYQYSSYGQEKPKSRGLLIGIIIGVVILIIIIVVVVLIIRSRSSSSGTGGTGGTGGGGTGTGTGGTGATGTSCTTNANCSSGVCNPQTGKCVECINDSTCGTTFPKCKLSTSTCVECIADGDCNAFETCINDRCCDPRPPEILSSTTTLSDNSSIELGYTLYQPAQTSTIVVVLVDPATDEPLVPLTCAEQPPKVCVTAGECPAGDECTDSKCVIPGCLSFQAGGNILLLENSTGIKFFAGVDYRVKMKVFYTCGTAEIQSTSYSTALDFPMGACSAQPNVCQILAVFAGIFYGPAFASYFILQYNIPFGSPEGSIGILIDDTPARHPNLVKYHDENFPIYDDFNTGFTKYTPVPWNFNSQFTSGTTIYIRAYRKGAAGQCDGAIFNEVSIVLA